jgi:hypothetical protein
MAKSTEVNDGRDKASAGGTLASASESAAKH